MDDIQSVTTTTLRDSHPERTGGLLPDPQKECTGLRLNSFIHNVTEIVKEHTFIENIPVVVVERVTPEGGARHTEWRAPSLDCYPLRSFMEFRHPETGALHRTERVATLIQPGEPPAELFDVPAWPEKSPIAAEETYLRMFKDGAINPKLYEYMGRQEKAYNDRH